MDGKKSRSRRDLTPGELKAVLHWFGPTDSAFVLHLAECEQCRGYAAKLLAPGDDDVLLHRTRGGYLLDLTGDPRPGDLPQVELHKFLRSLSYEQTAFIDHLLRCERCRHAVVKILKPPAAPSAPHASHDLSHS